MTVALLALEVGPTIGTVGGGWTMECTMRRPCRLEWLLVALYCIPLVQAVWWLFRWAALQPRRSGGANSRAGRMARLPPVRVPRWRRLHQARHTSEAVPPPHPADSDRAAFLCAAALPINRAHL